MGWDLALVSTIHSIGGVLFGHFEEKTPKWRKVLKIAVSLGITALLSHFFGHTGVFIALGIVLGAVVVIHAWWLPRNGINGWTAEPKERYYEFRGWNK